MVTVFEPWDDEGFVILTIKQFMSGKAYFTDVFSTYGPGWVEFWSAVFGISGAPLNSYTARIAVLVCWVLVSVLMGASVWRMTRHASLGLLTQIMTFVALRAMTTEPLHPGSLVCLVLALVVATAAFLLRARPPIAAALIGGLIGSLVMVKVNVGGLAAIAAAMTCCIGLFAAGTFWRRATWTLAAAVVLLPAALMTTRLTLTLNQRFGFAVTAAVLSVLITAWPITEDQISDETLARRKRLLFIAVGGAAVAALGSSVAILIAGTSLEGLVRGVIIQPLHQADAFSAPFRLLSPSEDIALFGLGLAVVTRWTGILQGRRRAVASALAGAIILWAIADPYLAGYFGSKGWMPSMIVGLSLAWLALPDREAGGGGGRTLLTLFVVLLAVLQTLHAYPVAGSQVQFGTFLFVAVAALALTRAWDAGSVWKDGAIVAAVIVAAFIVKSVMNGVVQPLHAARLEYRVNPPLNLPGTGPMRIDAGQTKDLQGLSAFLKRDCPVFISTPGLGSLYQFTDSQPPGGINMNTWMFHNDATWQQRIVDTLQRSPRVCVVTNQRVLGFWSHGRPVPNRPLWVYQKTATKQVAKFGDFTVRVKVNKP